MALHARDYQARGCWLVRKPYDDHGKLCWRLRNTATDDERRFRAHSHRRLDATQEFEAWFEAIVAEDRRREAGVLVTPRPLAAAVDEFLCVVAAGIRQPTEDDYKSTLSGVLIPELAAHTEKAPETLTTEDLDLPGIEYLLVTAAKEREWSGRTRLKTLGLVSRFAEWCVRHGYLAKNPAKSFDPPKSWNRERTEGLRKSAALSDDDCRAVLRAASEPYVLHVKADSGPRTGRAWTQKLTPPPYLAMAILISTRSGLRLKNVRELKWSNLSDDMTTLTIVGDDMKAGRELRVPLHPELSQRLRGLLRERTEELGRAPKGSEHVLGSCDSDYRQPIGATPLQRAYALALKRAELADKGYNFHSLRHTFVTRVEEHCGFAAAVMLAGHSMRSAAGAETGRYLHVTPERLREELEKLPWLSPKEADAVVTGEKICR